MQSVGDRKEHGLRLLEKLGEFIEKHPPELTYLCWKCLDLRFLVRIDKKGQAFGKPCDCLLGDQKDKSRGKVVKLSPVPD